MTQDMHFKVKVKVTLHVPSQKLKITQFWSYLGQKGGPGVNFTKQFCRQKMRLNLKYHFRQKNAYIGKGTTYQTKNNIFDRFCPKRVPGIGLIEIFFNQKMCLDLNYHFILKNHAYQGKSHAYRAKN